MSIVILPAYKPDEQLPRLVEQLWEYGDKILVVDDGSGDAYAQIFEKVRDVAIVLHHTVNRGKGAAIKTALAYIAEEVWEEESIGVMDSDGQHTVTDMQKVLQEASLHPEALVLGVRKVGRDMPLKSRMGNQLTRQLFHMVSGIWVSDTQTGLRAFDRSFIEQLLEIEGERYEYEMNVLLAFARQKVSIREVPIDTIYHDKGNSCSHFRIIRDSARIYAKLLTFMSASLSSFVLDYLLFAGLMVVMPRTAGYILLANVLARVCSALWNYSLNSHLVFKTGAKAQTAVEYMALAFGILLLNNLFLEGFTQLLQIPVLPAKVCTELCLFVISWTVQSRIIFKKRTQKICVHGKVVTESV